ncbi:hypothetical protein OS188_13575 [Xanthomarina sp. F1114]|uniref:hypothetical protein n=1 Tax=Xanthomarina sp. F1114 TaxID=2996019 RepID=UPI00225DCDBF|nr:hypothetical protein [Xanthomarina sp. F1114]MCX7548980.1 hypothetical protein [Xanthomarina sp. F1114]
MKFPIIISIFISQLFFLAATNCSDTDKNVSCNDRLTNLDTQRDQIRSLAETSICNDNYECRYIAFGRKPCGRAWEYLVYSTSIDTLKLENWVTNFNSMEATYNKECDAISDCMAVLAPTGFECKNNSCFPIY